MLTELYGKVPSKSDDSDLLALLSGHYVSSPAFDMSQQVTRHRWAFLLGVLVHTHSICIHIWDIAKTLCIFRGFARPLLNHGLLQAATDC